MRSIRPDWLDEAEYPFTSYFHDVNGHRLHYIDEGAGDAILFVHGTPSWSFEFRQIIKVLRSQYRCIAIDHIGFGLSDKPERYDYSTRNHGLTLERFIQEKELDNITMVVHDFGGPIGLSCAIRFPDKIKNLVIINSWLWSSERDPEYAKFRRILKNPLLPFLYLYLNFSPRYILPRSFGDRKLPGHLLKQYTRPFGRKSERFGALAFARSLLNDQNWYEELWNSRSAISDKPVLFVWGMKDPVILQKNLYKFVSGFSNSQICKLESCGHFPHEEQAETVIEKILSFVG